MPVKVPYFERFAQWKKILKRPQATHNQQLASEAGNAVRIFVYRPMYAGTKFPQAATGSTNHNFS
jgi:hypothetical protein